MRQVVGLLGPSKGKGRETEILVKKKVGRVKICVIHGSPRRAIHRARKYSWRKKYGDVKFTEFFLPKAMPYFCNGCFNLGEDKCPNAKYVEPIKEGMRETDGLRFSSPVYFMSESAQIKALLDHFGHIYMSHRPMKRCSPKLQWLYTL